MGISMFGITELFLVVISMGFILGSSLSEGNLQPGFYSSTCPTAESVVRSTVQQSVQADPTLAAGLLRLHYHDCFVQGCDASILIAGANAERTAPGHSGLRGFDVIENAKKQIERICPGVVSCADIVALAARDAVALSNGPNYDVPTGRRDGIRSSAGDAFDMPDPTDSVDVLKRKFAAKGLSTSDLVVLNDGSWGSFQRSASFVDSNTEWEEGAHTIGTTACFFIEDRLYNFAADGEADPSINPEYLTELKSVCPKGGDVNARLALDRGSEFQFDNQFLENVREGNGALQSDASMYQDTTTRQYIDSYFGLLVGILGPSFESDFASAMIKLGQAGVKTGSNGKIRRVCSAL